MARLGRTIPRRLKYPPTAAVIADTGPGARTASDSAGGTDSVSRVLTKHATATDSAPATDSVVPLVTLNPAVPRPVLPTFVDGQVPTADSLNALSGNIANLYTLLHQYFRRDIRPMTIMRVARENMELPTGVATAISFDVVDIDSGFMWNGQGQRSAGVARPGIYLLGFQWVSAPVVQLVGAVHQAWITLNSEDVTTGAIAYGSAPQQAAIGVFAGTEVALNGGDVLRFYARHDQGTTLPVSPIWGGTRAWMIWLAPLAADDVAADPDTPAPPAPDTGVYTTPGQALNIGPDPGQNHFNVGIGFAPGDDPNGETTAIHRDFSEAVIDGGFSQPGYFELNATNTAVKFSAALDGGTTSSNTKYPRSELREFRQDGTTRADWNGGTGLHYMEGKSKITLDPDLIKPWVVFCQIHDAESDLMRVQTEGTSPANLKVVMRATPPGGGTEVSTIIKPSFTSGTELNWKLEVNGGAGKVYLDGVVVGTFNGNSGGCYFKAGAYAQTDVGDVGETVTNGPIIVELRDFTTWHTGYPPPSRPGGGTDTPGGTDPPPTGTGPIPATATLLSTLNYDTGNYSQWGTIQCQGYNGSASGWAGGRPAQVVNGGTGHGSCSRIEVRSGDSAASGERSEARAGSVNSVVEGDERYYQFSVKFDAGFPSPTGGWCIIMQWHAGTGSPPLAIEYSTSGKLVIGNNRPGDTYETVIGAADPGNWHDYVLHAKFSNSASTGFIEVWRDGALVIPKKFVKTMGSTENYLKQGLYRGPMSATQVVFHDGLKIYRP